ncbi:hypothetical protein ACHAPQ_010373 [Fusarium lateritium]
MTTNGLLELYQGHIVPKAYNAGYVTLSYLVSLVGAASTLELVNRRSWFNGISNHLNLVCSAITMGGIAIWCMHFIGNQALTLGEGETEMQVAYSSGITVLSFCMPVLILLAAFYAIGFSNRISWLRVLTAGVLCGSAICGMHYLADASIENYTCVYNKAYIVGAAIIAVIASTVALAMFFIFQSLSASSWWKRLIAAFLLAGAVSSMHWCASIGTEYRLLHLKKVRGGSRTATMVAVVCLQSIGACIIIAGSAILRSRTLKQAAHRAQEITLGAIIFNRNGYILVDNNGVFPNTVVTDVFIGENTKEQFNTSHSQFHWMFQASRNWIGISGLINGMKQHLAQLPHNSHHKDPQKGIQLLTDDGKLIDGYNLIFRELFCVAASMLGESLDKPLISLGVLWDTILPKKTIINQAYLQGLKKHRRRRTIELGNMGNRGLPKVDFVEEGVQHENDMNGRGALMFLVQRLTTEDQVERLESAGYRFVDPAQVSKKSRSHLQIQCSEVEFELKLRDMKDFVGQQVTIKSGVHLSLFAVQDTMVDKPQVLVRTDARHLIPSVPLPIKSFGEPHIGILRDLDGLVAPELLQRLRTSGASPRSPAEEEFAKHLSNAINSLRGWVQEPLFHDAVLTSSIVRLPFGMDGDQADETVIMALRLKIPRPVISSSSNCQWIPLDFFRMRQRLTQSSQEFLRVLHHDFDPLKMPVSWANNQLTSGPFSTLRRLKGVASVPSSGIRTRVPLTRLRGTSKDLNRSSSTVDLCPSGDGKNKIERQSSTDTTVNYPTPAPQYTSRQQTYLNGGIVVFQEVTVQVETKKPESYYDLARSWSMDITTKQPDAQSQQYQLPMPQDYELQSFGWGKTDISIKSHQVQDPGQPDSNILTVSSFIETLIIESKISSILP